MNTPEKRIGLGIMSGTSLDGIDLALCKFNSDQDVHLLAFETIPYPEFWREKLHLAPSLEGLGLLLMANEYTRYTARAVANFLGQAPAIPHYIGAHGHTVFHRPELGFTYQMLNGALLSALTKLTVVCDFRTLDMGLGGQGAPLVPIGDRLLYGAYHACINLGGFSNISFERDGDRLACDVSPANIALNAIANMAGLPYDDRGKISASGVVIPELLEAFNGLKYYSSAPPKSLGREWLESAFDPILNRYKDVGVKNLGRTVTEHIAIQIGAALAGFGPAHQVLATGGGVHNDFLMNRIRAHTVCKIEIPDGQIADAKEAIIFALLGKLRLEGKINTLASVTGATADSAGGAVFLHS